ncbi:RNA polymerase sigma factor [Marinoscillum sp. 108]|jgi:RNA polymerase sigma-70 factor (ECF subfamily)|uniref:RNA polymerase sigma factor n=1 Tax=Marinoscillum luteum TaxID=861051 RepID=A0ABW7N8Z4_9BACT|nr:RNA polymerase sigma factor [Marinoscillum sp. 108]
MSPNQLFETHIIPATGKMFRYAKSILKETELAQDVVQECLAKIWTKRQMLEGVQSPEAWAMRITRNQCYDWVKTNRFTVISDQEMDQPNNDSADYQALMTDQMHWLEKVLDTLSPKQREIYHLREIEEMPYQEIAEVLSLNLSEVKVSLHRARTKIRSSMEKIESYGVAN